MEFVNETEISNALMGIRTARCILMIVWGIGGVRHCLCDFFGYLWDFPSMKCKNVKSFDFIDQRLC